jgi:hypothetical protein
MSESIEEAKRAIEFAKTSLGGASESSKPLSSDSTGKIQGPSSTRPERASTLRTSRLPSRSFGDAGRSRSSRIARITLSTRQNDGVVTTD